MFAWPLPGAGYRTWLTVAAPMTQRLSPGTAAMLAAAPLLWAGNAVVGRALHTLIAPSTLNFLRWLLAFALLLPLAWQVLRPASGLWPHWRRYALLAGRRPRFLTRRKTGCFAERPVVIQGEILSG